MTRSLQLVCTLLVATTLFAADPLVAFDPVASGLPEPVSITHAGDSRLFITLQSGLVMIFDGTRVLTTPFLDVRNLVSTGNERGLLSVAFHPRYAENGFFYVDYTNTNGDTVVARYHVSGDPNRADPNSAQQLLFVAQPFANHNGGQLQFGPGGYLYIGMGDGGSAGDPGNRAQNLNELLGKLLRIDVDGAFPYAIPASNPFAHGGGRAEIWAYGLRNPWRFAFDRANGNLWIADVGQGSWEEVDVQPSTSIGGENYGWRVMEGTHCFNPATNCNRNGLVLPVLEYNHSGDACSVTGGYVYRGTLSPRLQGTYLYGDFCNGRVWGAVLGQQGTVTITTFADTAFNISTFGEDINGEVYVADYAGGAIYHIVDSRPFAPARRRTVRH